MSKAVAALFMLVVPCLAAGCSGAGADGTFENQEMSEANLGESQEAILGGVEVTTNSYGIVALYHMKKENADAPLKWWGRPCSARVLNPHSDRLAILTARHCITQDGNIRSGAPLNTPAQLRVTSAVKPGPSKPDYAFQPEEVVDSPDADLAIIWATGNLKLPSTVAHVGLNVTPTADYVNFGISQYGYGWGREDDDSSTGILRMGYFYEVTGASSRNYDYSNHPTQAGGGVTHGDSGGPSLLTWVTGPDSSHISVRTVQLGVHSTLDPDLDTGHDAAIAENFDFIMNELGSVYLRNVNQDDRRVYVTETGSVAKSQPNGDGDGSSRFKYSVEKGRMSSKAYSGKCLAVQSALTPHLDPSVALSDCDSSDTRQVFRFTALGQMRNPASNKCVRLSSSNELKMHSCSSEAAQRWIVDADYGN